MSVSEGRKADGRFDEILIDGDRSQVSNALNAWKVDQGLLFGFYDENIEVDAAENNDVLIVTGANHVHIVFESSGLGGSIIAQIYEGVTASNNGTPMSIGAFNRVIGGLPATTTIFKTPTVSDTGTLIVNRRLLGGPNQGNPISSATSPGAHRILKPNTKYLIRLTGVVNDTMMTLAGTFYES